MLTLLTVMESTDIPTPLKWTGLLTDLFMFTRTRTESSSGTQEVLDGPLERLIILNQEIIGIEAVWILMNPGRENGKVVWRSHVLTLKQGTPVSMVPLETGAGVLLPVVLVHRHVSEELLKVVTDVEKPVIADLARLLHVQLIANGVAGDHGALAQNPVEQVSSYAVEMFLHVHQVVALVIRVKDWMREHVQFLSVLQRIVV